MNERESASSVLFFLSTHGRIWMKVVFNIYFPGVNIGIFILLFPLPYYIFFEVNNYMGLTCIWVFAK